MLYEQREKSIEQRGEFEEELIGSGGTSLEACAPSKLVSELLSEGVGRCGIGAEGGRGHSARTGGGEGRGGAPPSLDRGQLDPLGTALKKLTSRHEVRAQA